MNGQLQLFAESRRLVDVPLEQRHAGATVVLEAEPDLDTLDRIELLMLLIAPALLAEAER